MKRTMLFCLAAAFAVICVGLVVFLHQFTVVDGSWTYLDWEQSSIVSADGEQRDFDPMAGEPTLENGESFRFALTVPERSETGSYLVFEITGAETTVFLNGQEIYAAGAAAQEHTINLGQVQLPLPAGEAEELVMEVRPLSNSMGLFPPLLRLIADPSDTKSKIAYGNYYRLPAGAMALALALIWGLFLYGVFNRKTDWLLLVLTGIGLTVHPIAVEYGWYFLSEPLLSALCWRGIPLLSALALMIYLLLHRERIFLKALLSIWDMVRTVIRV